MRRIIDLLDRYLNRVELLLVVLILSVMVIMAFVQVLLRNFLSTGIIWGDIFLRHLVLWVGFIGASIAAREARHINIDVLRKILPSRILPFIKLGLDIATALTCFLLAWAGYQFVKMEYESASIIFENVPAWIFQMIIPIGFALIGIRFLIRGYQDFNDRERRSKKAEKELNAPILLSQTGLEE